MDNLRFNLKVKSGPAVSTSCVLSHEKHITFGRNDENDYVLSNDAGISRQHFEIYFDNGKCWIKDLNSRNGTYVNSCPILSGQLKAGDEIRAGNTLLVVEASPTPADSKLLPDQYVGPKVNLMIGDDTTVVAPRKIHSAKMGRSRIHSEAFFELFHDLPGQAVLIYGQQDLESRKNDTNFVVLNANCAICYPSEVQNIKTLVKNTDPSSLMMLNFTSSRSGLQEHIRDHSKAFVSPEQFLNSFQELPSELSNALLNGIDLLICDSDTSDEVALLFEKRHSIWLSKLIRTSTAAQSDIN